MQTACVYIWQSQLFVGTSSEVGVCCLPPATESVFHVSVFTRTFRNLLEESSCCETFCVLNLVKFCRWAGNAITQNALQQDGRNTGTFFFSLDSRDREENTHKVLCSIKTEKHIKWKGVYGLLSDIWILLLRASNFWQIIRAVWQ